MSGQPDDRPGSHGGGIRPEMPHRGPRRNALEIDKKLSAVRVFSHRRQSRMTALILSITFGLGVYLIYEGITSPHPPLARARLRELEDFLARAGFPAVKPRDFALAALTCGIAAGGIAQILLGWAFVSALASG